MKILYLFIYFIFVIHLSSDVKKPKPEKSIHKKYTLFFYGGQFVNSDLLPILLQGNFKYLPSFIGVTGLSVPLKSKLDKIGFESEGQIVKHFGLMNHIEVNTAVLARTNIPKTQFSFAFGEGLSYASENPGLENSKKFTFLTNGSFNTNNSVNSRNLLNFLIFELDYPLSNFIHQPKLFARIHHRSGVFGLFCGMPPCGSNFIAYGVKFSL